MFGRRRGRAGARLLTADRAVLCVVLSGLCALRLLHLQLRPPEHVGLVIIQPTPARRRRLCLRRALCHVSRRVFVRRADTCAKRAAIYVKLDYRTVCRQCRATSRAVWHSTAQLAAALVGRRE